VDEALQFAFVGRGDRNHGFAFADRNLGVGIDDTGAFGGRQHGLQAFGGLSLAFADGAPDLQQTGRSVVLHVTEAIDDGVDPLHDFGKGRDAAAAGWETVSGLDMFIGQGDAQFHLWTGHHLPEEAITAVTSALYGQ